MKALKINIIYKMNCFSFLSKIKNETIDLAIIDPPYNMKKAPWDTFETQKDFLDFTYKWIDLLITKLKKTASLYIFNTPYNSAFILKYLVEKKMLFQNWITWDKKDGLGSAKRKYSNGQETILFFTVSNKYTFNFEDIRIPYESVERMKTAKSKGILKNGKRWFPNPNGKLCGEVWHFSSQRHNEKIKGKTQKLEHITPKPTKMIERMIKASSNKGDLILDCFVGIGTTAYVSKILERNFICSDINENYVQIAKEKLKNAQ